MSTESEQNPDVVKRTAKVAGGQAYFPYTVTKVENIFQEVARDLREQYTLGYVPPNATSSGSYHKVRVQVIAPGKRRLVVRTRSGYYTPAPGPPAQVADMVGASGGGPQP